MIDIYVKNIIMKKVVRLTESDLRRVVKRIINETEAKDMADNAMLKSKEADRGIKNEIINCIKNGSYTHLMALTTGVGEKALGALAVLFFGGVVKGPLIIMAAGDIIRRITGMMTKSDSERGSSVKDELEQLYNCLKEKGVI